MNRIISRRSPQRPTSFTSPIQVDVSRVFENVSSIILAPDFSIFLKRMYQYPLTVLYIDSHPGRVSSRAPIPNDLVTVLNLLTSCPISFVPVLYPGFRSLGIPRHGERKDCSDGVGYNSRRKTLKSSPRFPVSILYQWTLFVLPSDGPTTHLQDLRKE